MSTRRHAIRDIIGAIIMFAAIVAGIYFGTPPSHPQQQSTTATDIVCLAAPSNSAHQLTTTPRTDGYYVGRGTDGRYHAVEFTPDNKVSYARGAVGDSAATMPSHLRNDPPVNYDQNGSFTLTDFAENFTMSFVGDSLILTATTTVGCLDNKVRTVSATLHFASTPVQTA